MAKIDKSTEVKNIGPTGEHSAAAEFTVAVPFLRTQYNYDSGAASQDATVKEYGPSMTVQDQAWNLHDALVRSGVVGQMPQGVKPVFYGDFENINDFASAMNAVREAQENFDLLPAEVRAKFTNNPQKFLEFCEDPKNVKEIVSMGLSVPEGFGVDISPSTADNTVAENVQPKKE